jgi:hypothetical protein
MIPETLPAAVPREVPTLMVFVLLQRLLPKRIARSEPLTLADVGTVHGHPTLPLCVESVSRTPCVVGPWIMTIPYTPGVRTPVFHAKFPAATSVLVMTFENTPPESPDVALLYRIVHPVAFDNPLKFAPNRSATSPTAVPEGKETVTMADEPVAVKMVLVPRICGCTCPRHTEAINNGSRSFTVCPQ